MGMKESRGKIATSTKELLALWRETKIQWDDANAKAFEEEFLRMLEQDAKEAAQAMDEMAALLDSIKRQCGEE